MMRLYTISCSLDASSQSNIVEELKLLRPNSSLKGDH